MRVGEMADFSKKTWSVVEMADFSEICFEMFLCQFSDCIFFFANFAGKDLHPKL